MGNIRLIALISVVLAFTEFLNGQEKSSVELIINTDRIADEFDGIGAVSAGATSRLLIDYPEPQRSQILDFLFKPNYGACLQHLKVEIGGDINSTDGSEPSHMRRKGEENYDRGYEWWLMEEARKRNPDIILDALAWGAPGWIGNGTYYSQDGADYIAKFLVGARTHHNLNINFEGVRNEGDLNVKWIKILRKTLDENGLTDVNIVASDLWGPHHNKNWAIADSMVADPVLAKAIFALGVHYASGNAPESALQLQKAGKKLWSSEEGEWNSDFWPERNKRAQKLNLNYINSHITKTEFWSPVTSCYDCLPAPGSGMIKANTPWSGAYEIEKTLWAVAHTTQFAKPGWLYLENACFKLPGGGSVVSLTNPDRNNVSIIIETMDASNTQEIVIKQEGEFNFKKLHVWHTNDLQDFMQEKDIYKVNVNGEFHFTLDPRSIYSLTTTNGQYKGRAGSPNPAPFPLPYADNFNSYPEGAVPKYLSDQSGAFEIQLDKNGNKILVQQIRQKGIEWASDNSVFSLIGDMNWTDIEVSADISFSMISKDVSEKPFAAVIARCFQGSQFSCNRVDNPVGYNFRLYADGNWKLLTASDELAGGQVDLKGKGWIKMKIKCQADRITTYIDNIKVCEITDSSYRRGLAGIGSSFEPVSFDNFYVYDGHSEK